MRYTCYKTIVSKVFDGILEGAEEIQNILQAIRNKELTCTLQVKGSPTYEAVRILGLTDDKITWRLVKDGTSLQKTSPISDIVGITIYIEEDLLVSLKPEPTRWSTLDASDI